MNARRVLYILIVIFLIVLALPRMSQAASMFTASADYAADSPIFYFVARAHSGVQPAVKCPSVYRVRLGDTLPSIAARCGVTTTAIIKANGLHSTRVWPGQRLYIPTPTPPVAPLPSPATKP